MNQTISKRSEVGIPNPSVSLIVDGNSLSPDLLPHPTDEGLQWFFPTPRFKAMATDLVHPPRSGLLVTGYVQYTISMLQAYKRWADIAGLAPFCWLRFFSLSPVMNLMTLRVFTIDLGEYQVVGYSKSQKLTLSRNHFESADITELLLTAVKMEWAGEVPCQTLQCTMLNLRPADETELSLSFGMITSENNDW